MAASPPKNSTHPKSRAAWRAGLAEQHQRNDGVWFISYKKATGKARFELDEAIEEALCFGWIDSKPAKLDAASSMLWFAPRKAGTNWSRLNKQRAERAIAAGRMTGAGLRKIEAAKNDGSWNALDAVEALELPKDLVAVLAAHPPAGKCFAAFPRSAKRGILEWIGNARTAATRQKRVAETAALAAKNLRANQWRKRQE